MAPSTLALLMLVAACGGDDPVSTPAASVAPERVTTVAPPPSPDLDLGLAPAALCASIIPEERVVEFLGQAAAFDEGADNGHDPALGAVICSWSSIDERGTTIEALGVQVYLGDPVPGGNFYLPEEWPEIRLIDDIGDDAFFASVQIRRTASFLWGQYVVILDYWPFAVSEPGLSTADELIDLLREVRDRVF